MTDIKKTTQGFLIKHYRENFTIADNTILQDKRLCYASKGLFMYIWSQKNYTRLIVAYLAKSHDTSKYKIYQLLNKLKDCGYVRCTRRQSCCYYELSDYGEFQCLENQHIENQHIENRDDIYNKKSKEYKKVKSNSNKDNKKINKKENESLLIEKEEVQNNEEVKKGEVVEHTELQFQSIYKEYTATPTIKDTTLKSKTYNSLYLKYKKALKNHNYADILEGIQDYITYLKEQKRIKGFLQDKKGMEAFFNQELWLGRDNHTWQEKINALHTEEANKNNKTKSNENSLILQSIFNDNDEDLKTKELPF